MIDIRLEGQSMDVLPGTSLTLEAFNPMFDFDTVQGSRVYNFSLPDTPKNRRTLGFFNNAQVRGHSKKFYCEKYFGSQLIERGYVMIQDSSADGYNLYFTQNLKEAFGDYQTKLFTEMDWGDDNTTYLNPSPADLGYEIAFPTIENPGFYGNQNVGGYSGKINNFSNGGYDPIARVPMVPLQWVLNMFGNSTGWTFNGSFTTDSDLYNLLLYNLNSADGLDYYRYSNQLPDMDFPSLLKAIRKLFNLYLDFDIRRKVLTMDFVDDILKADVTLDWSGKVAPTHTKVPDLQNRLELSYVLDGNDALMKPIPANFDKYTTPEIGNAVGGSVTPISSVFSTIQTNPQTGLGMTSQPGISPTNKDNTARSSPKFVFWNGMVNGVPTATNSINGKTLCWHGPGNLVDTYWKQYERFRVNSFMLKKNAILTPADLSRFSFRQKVHIRGVNYIVANYKAALGADDKIIPAELELWKV